MKYMKSKWQSGQSLLVIVLLISVVFTLIASASFRLTTETQSAKIQEETVRTLAAADSGVEVGLQVLNSSTTSGTYPFSHASVNISLDGIDSTKSFIDIDTDSTDNVFDTEILANEQYTFYLYPYPSGASFTNNMDIYYGPQGGTCGSTGRTNPSLEFTLIYGAASNQIERWMAEPCASNPRIEGSINKLASVGGPFNRGGTNYGYRIDFDGILSSHAEPKFLIIRSLYAQTNVRLESSPSSANFPIQGQTITSTAVSNTGVSKVVSLFRSFPQIPADFFVTQF